MRRLTVSLFDHLIGARNREVRLTPKTDIAELTSPVWPLTSERCPKAVYGHLRSVNR
jgi:hypothetical protein